MLVSRRTLKQLLAEKDRQIDILAEQIDWLRGQLGAPSLHRVESVNPSEQPPISFEAKPFLDEDEEDVRHMMEAGLISKDQLPEVLEALGIANTEFA